MLELICIIGLILLNIPSATILILLVCIIKIGIRKLSWKDIGFETPKNILRTMMLGLMIAILYQLLSIMVFVPIISSFTATRIDLSKIIALKDSWNNMLFAIIMSWTFAAFGEEIVYRGYMNDLIHRVFARPKAGMILGLMISTILFALGHGYQGISGIVENIIFGLTMGIVYSLSRKNLWLPILIHGFVDTIGLGLIFAGWYS